MNPLAIPVDFEKRMLDFCREVMTSQGVIELAAAELSVRWSVTSFGRLPILIIAFDLPEFAASNAIPSLAIALCRVRKGTLLELETAGTFYEPGDALRTHLLRSVDAYLTTHGIRLCLDEEQAARFASKPS